MTTKYIPETNVHVTVKIDSIEVADENRLSNEEIIKIFNIAFTYIKEKLGVYVQYSLMNDKMISERSIEVLENNQYNVSCSFYWEKEYELDETISNFNSIKLHLHNKINEDLEKLIKDKRVDWVYPDIHNVRIIQEKCDCNCHELKEMMKIYLEKDTEFENLMIDDPQVQILGKELDEMKEEILRKINL
jgi:hypothetical protein